LPAGCQQPQGTARRAVCAAAAVPDILQVRKLPLQYFKHILYPSMYCTQCIRLDYHSGDAGF
jgi:hypothetical protein